MDNSSLKHTLGIVCLSFAILLALSAMPIGRLSNNLVKDFNLFEDLFPTAEPTKSVETFETAQIDEELSELLAQAEPEAIGEPSEVTEETSVVSPAVEEPLIHTAPVSEGVVCFENYTNSPLLSRFKAALAENSGTVNIAVIGDSFIEGDIFCEDLRELFQNRFGGSGVGHLSLHTDFPGFRKSVVQSDAGWKLHDIRTMSSRDSLRQLSGDYCTAETSASATFKGSSYGNGTKEWSKSSFTFISASEGTIALTTDAGTETFDVVPDEAPVTLSVQGQTTKFKIESNVPGLKALGVNLDGNTGVQLDCMSVRGNSGITHAKLNETLISSLRKNRDYSLIIIEFGMNALSAEQTNYTPYRTGMQKVVDKIRGCYPGADIIVMGVGDRGIKEGTEIKSMASCTAMVKAQRELARNSGVIFWDTREAMGGPGAVADWRKRRLVNADYIHLNHAGGKELATLMFNAFAKAFDE